MLLIDQDFGPFIPRPLTVKRLDLSRIPSSTSLLSSPNASHAIVEIFHEAQSSHSVTGELLPISPESTVSLSSMPLNHNTVESKLISGDFLSTACVVTSRQPEAQLPALSPQNRTAESVIFVSMGSIQSSADRVNEGMPEGNEANLLSSGAICYARALYSFHGDQTGDLRIEKFDVIEVNSTNATLMGRDTFIYIDVRCGDKMRAAGGKVVW
jgi:hypothetical protein